MLKIHMDDKGRATEKFAFTAFYETPNLRRYI